MDREIEAVIEALRERRDHLYAVAERIVEPFWDAHYAHRGQREDNGVHGVRLQKGAAGISVHWFRTSFYRKANGAWGALQNYIRLGDKYRYQRKDFGKMREWEREMALEMEAQLEPIRRSAAALVQSSKMLRADDKRIRALLEKFPHLNPAGETTEPESEKTGEAGEG